MDRTDGFVVTTPSLQPGVWIGYAQFMDSALLQLDTVTREPPPYFLESALWNTTGWWITGDGIDRTVY